MSSKRIHTQNKKNKKKRPSLIKAKFQNCRNPKLVLFRLPTAQQKSLLLKKKKKMIYYMMQTTRAALIGVTGTTTTTTRTMIRSSSSSSLSCSSSSSSLPFRKLNSNAMNSRRIRTRRRSGSFSNDKDNNKNKVLVRSSDEEDTIVKGSDFDRNLNKFVKKTATTFAPSGSGDAKRKKNPAQKGTVLYKIFEVQAYLAILVGGLLAYNVIFPSEEPTIARLMGMWSLWMFTVPSLRARDCGLKEKDALNVLFIAIPLINVLIPFFWKSFAGVFTADCALMALVYYQKNAPPFGEEDIPTEDLSSSSSSSNANPATTIDAK